MTTTRKTTASKAPARRGRSGAEFAPKVTARAPAATKATKATKASKATASKTPAAAKVTALAIGSIVTAAREAAGIDTKELAARMNTSDGAIRRLERGDTNATTAYLARVASALGAGLEIRIV